MVEVLPLLKPEVRLKACELLDTAVNRCALLKDNSILKFLMSMVICQVDNSIVLKDRAYVVDVGKEMETMFR
jgi:hypothetical protein